MPVQVGCQLVKGNGPGCNSRTLLADVTVSMYSIFNHLFVQTILSTRAREFLTPVKRKGPVSNAIALVAHARDYVDIDITVSMIFNHLLGQTVLDPVKESCCVD